MQRIYKKTGIHLSIGVIALFGLNYNAAAIPALNGTKADAISGTVTKTVRGMAPTTVTIVPVTQSIAGILNNAPESTNNSAGSASQTVFGVEVYNFLDINNTTVAGNYSDYEAAEAKIGIGSLLGGLVKWNSNDNSMTGGFDEDTPAATYSATETIQGLTINQAAVPLYPYPAGTSIPVNGIISDPECSGGTETFSGYIILEESQYSIQYGIDFTTNLNGMHLVGQATCKTSSPVPLFTTTYDLRVAESQGRQIEESEGPWVPTLKVTVNVILQ